MKVTMDNADRLKAAWEYSTGNYLRANYRNDQSGERIESSFVDVLTGHVVTRILYWDGKAKSITTCFVPKGK